MDENLQAKIDQARAAGYSDDEIQAYLNPKPETPAPTVSTGNGPVNPYVDRSEEKAAIGEYGAAKALQYGVGIGTGYGVTKGLINAFKGGPATNLPVTGSPEHSMETLKNPTGQAASRAPTLLEQAGSLASRYAPIARLATGAGAALYSPSLNAGEQQELIKIRAREEAARRAGLIK